MQLRKAAFRKWLKAKEENEIVGKPKCSLECPVANYLCEQNPDLFISVGIQRYGHSGNRRILPKFAQCFIAEVDAILPRVSVTARTALRILDEC